MDIQKIKKLLKKIFILPPIPTLLVAVPSNLLVIYVLANGMEKEVVSYIAYLLSAYAVIVTVTGITRIVRLVKPRIVNHPFVKKAFRVPVIEKYFREVMFRTETALYRGLFINLLYVIIKFYSGIYYRSVWFISLSFYYLLLALMRSSLLNYVRSRKEDKTAECKRYRFCGIILLFMNQALGVVVAIAVKQNKGFEYSGLLIYAMALYAFYSIITAVINAVKFRKYGSLIVSAAKVINLTAALVSMLSLETAMIAQFGDNDSVFRQIMTSATGAGVCLIVLEMAVYMIRRSTKLLKNIENEQGGNV